LSYSRLVSQVYLFPLKIAQKNEQFYNTEEARIKLGSIVIEENDLNKDSLLKAIENIRGKSHGVTVKSNPTEQIINYLLGD
jgi:UDP-N-acetylglucosamine:LPS N-acetylglucosamine transferase